MNIRRSATIEIVSTILTDSGSGYCTVAGFQPHTLFSGYSAGAIQVVRMRKERNILRVLIGLVLGIGSYLLAGCASGAGGDKVAQ